MQDITKLIADMALACATAEQARETFSRILTDAQKRVNHVYRHDPVLQELDKQKWELRRKVWARENELREQDPEFAEASHTYCKLNKLWRTWQASIGSEDDENYHIGGHLDNTEYD